MITAVRNATRQDVPCVTTSSISDLLNCPKKFFELRIRRNFPPYVLNDSVERGKALHGVLRDLYSGRVGGEIPLERLLVISDRHMRAANYSPEADKEHERQRVRAMARAFVDADDWEDIEGVISIEQSIDYDLQSQGRALLKITARLDKVHVRNQQQERHLIVTDWKSGAIRVDLAESYVTLRAAKHKWPGYDRYILEYNGLDQDDRVVREAVDYARECKDMHDYFRSRAVEVLTAGRERGEWPATPGSCCDFCHLRRECQGLDPDDINNF